MRGDRPEATWGWAEAWQATPHARGSTPAACSSGTSICGYPACAGIDRCRVDCAHFGRRLPRMRGDRPLLKNPTTAITRATPHARGSTSSGPWQTALGRGYPACAGIDLSFGTPRHTWAGLPRMRGDRPRPVPAYRGRKRATPHARGSTGIRVSSAPSGKGYPACAGIDLIERRSTPWATRLPRMRGDRPKAKPPQIAAGLATPHARGSTPLFDGPICDF